MEITLKIGNSVVVKNSGLLGTIVDIETDRKLYGVRTIDFETTHFKESELVADMFEHSESLPSEVQEVLQKYAEADETYENCANMLAEMEVLGYTFEYYLDATPYFLRKKDLVVLN
jgi:hypothetical protein